MALRAIVKFLAVALVAVEAGKNVRDVTTPTLNHRRLGGSSPGDMAMGYSPFHLSAYPANGGTVNIDALRAGIDSDFRQMSQYVGTVRTFYSQHFGIRVAPIAAKYGVKLYLGAYITEESWWDDEANATADAIKTYGGTTVEAVFVGSENLVNFQQRSWHIINKVKDIKARAGDAASRVRYGTTQRVNEFLDNHFDRDLQQLQQYLDILGVNIYPGFNNWYDGNKPTDLLDAQWNAVTSKWNTAHICLMETGFPTAGAPSSISPNVHPGLDAAVNYYRGVVNWTPRTGTSCPKFWFLGYDRQSGDPASNPDLERHWGFWTKEGWTKRDGFPLPLSAGGQSRESTSTSSSSRPIEEGVDYSGRDVGNKPASNAEDCFDICSSVDGCGAFTWTNYNGGTCWLKAERGSAKPNSGARSGILCKCNAATIEGGVDYIGNDIGSVSGSNVQACIPACQNKPGCGAFTWTDYNGGTCWLKSAKGATTQPNSAAKSGVLGYAPEVGVDYVGNDIGSAYGANAQACIPACKNKPGCHAFTWSDYDGGTCWLKSAKGATNPKDGVVSGVVC